MDDAKLTTIIVTVSLSVLWFITGIINYFIIRNYTNNKTIKGLFACSGFLGSLMLGFLVLLN